MAPYYNPNAVSQALSQENLQPIDAPPVGRYFAPRGVDRFNVTSTPGTVFAANLLDHQAFMSGIFFTPIVLAQTVTADQVGFIIRDVNGAVDTWTYSFGIYSHNPDTNYPDALLSTYGSVVFNPASSPTGPQLTTISQQFSAGTIYWVATGFQTSGMTDISAGITPAVDQASGDFALFRKRGTTSVFSSAPGYAWVHSINTFNGTFPSTVAYAQNAASTSSAIRVSFRRSA